MENAHKKAMEEEIRQHKLYKIQITEAKIREYEHTFNTIKENNVIKFTKNASSSVLRIIFFVVAVGLFIIGIFFLFPEQMIKILEKNEAYFSVQEKRDFILTAPYLGYIFISISILFGFISSLLKKNIRKRNSIYDLSKLIKEVIDYMHENVKEDKKKYEYYVDSIADIETRKRNTDTTTQTQ